MRIGIVGGIGSGKSTVGQILCDLGAVVLDADKENALLLQDPAYIALLGALVPHSVVDGVVDKAVVRRWMLADAANRMALERLAHPLLRDRLLAKMPAGVCFVELSAYRPDFMPLDELWLVRAEIEARVARIVARSGWSTDEARAMIKAQQCDMTAHSTVILDNSGDIAALRAQVIAQYNRVLAAE